MKRVFSILFAIMILFSGLTVNLAIHYCGGKAASRKLSFSGEVASCGMDSHQSSKGLHNPSCCSNVVKSYTFSNTFFSSSVSSETAKILVQPVHANIEPFTFERPAAELYAPNNRPPGILLTRDVELDFICIFRI
ncbi:MAG TPA: hypothetical protein VHO68_14575 [Bacteroidales bacterium]|nr:hypothetical protein [Bacteroidales bacterium]